MRRCFFVILLLLVLSPSQAAELIWQVEHPFRFLRFASDHRIHEIAYEHARTREEFKSAPVSTMEALLNDPVWWGKPQTNLPKKPTEISPFQEIARIRDELEGAETDLKRKPLSAVSPDNLRLGWSAMLRNHDGGQPADGTCWNIRTQNYYFCESEASGVEKTKHGYVMPKFHYVKASISGNVGGQCRFELGMLDGSKLQKGALILLDNDKRGRTDKIAEFECTKNVVLLKLPYEPDNKTSESKYKYILTTASLDASGQVDNRINLSTEIFVKDIVIVAMGDSFSSGEGNPDVPATLDPVHVQIRSYDKNKNPSSRLGFPRRAGTKADLTNKSAAYWIDRRCHRSMYGAPTRAAIALSFSGRRHHAVTFLNFSCSGAEITDGLLWPQNGQECIESRNENEFNFMEPQISGVVRELGLETGTYSYFRAVLNRQDRFVKQYNTNVDKLISEKGYCDNWPGKRRLHYKGAGPYLYKANIKRKIDLLFMSIAGNDAGFSPLIANATLNDVSVFPRNKNSFLTKFAREAANGITLAEAKENLRTTLPYRLDTLENAIKQKLEMDDNKRVILAAYPSITKMKNGKVCAPNSGVKRSNLGMSVSRFFSFNKLGDSEIDAKDADEFVSHLNNAISLKERTIWDLETSHLDAFNGHAICSTATITAKNRHAENFLLPRKREGMPASAWKTDDDLKFDPTTDFRLYAKRQRWFRTYNDAYLGVQYFKRSASDEKNLRKGNFITDAEAGEYNAKRALGGPFHPTAEGHAAIADALVKAGMKKLNLEWQ